MQARIAGTGRAVAPVLVTNASMNERFGAGVGEWVEANVGIAQRFHMAPEQATSDLAAHAATQAIARAGLSALDIDLIVLSTDTPDHLSPSTAAVVQHRIGATKAACFDINAACSGWVVALDTAAMHLKADSARKHVLVIGAYGISRFLDWSDRNTATLFADGAGAVVLSASDEPGFLASTLFTDASLWDALGIFEGGTRKPAGGEVHAHVKFVRKFPRTYNTEHWPRLLRETAANATCRSMR